MSLVWKIERTYPRKAEHRPYDQPERWEGQGLISLIKQFEDTAQLERDEADEMLANLIERMRTKASISHELIYGPEGQERVIEIELRWETEP